ncbi:MAG: hypothetical protein JSU01_12585, partial [Bacteroidetes bacterium]|nr:hypothetical protein [Bacteroidota bacterium]
MKKLFIFLLVAFGHSASAQDVRPQFYGPIVPNKVADKYIPAYYQDISGLLGYRLGINLDKRLLQIDSATLLS